MRELKNGVFGGWSEGILNFPPTYKYEVNSDKYYGEDPKVGKRSPAWYAFILRCGFHVCKSCAFIFIYLLTKPLFCLCFQIS